MSGADLTGLSLNATLAALGYRTEPHRRAGAKAIIDSAGRTVFAGTAAEVWAWLREAGLLPAEVAP